MTILFRSCGGLGNQVFQLLFTRLLAKKYNVKKIVHYHEKKYNRIAIWEYPNSQTFSSPSFFEMLIIKLRIPKLIFRSKLSKKEHFNFLGFHIIDGYFQSYDCYNNFTSDLLLNEVNLIRKELNIHNFKKKDFLYHLRLGDFFRNKIDELNFVIEILNNVDSGISIISNNDNLFTSNQPILNLLNKKNINYIITSEFTSVSLIRLFASFECIYTNGSSLVFITSILSNNTTKKISEISLNQYQETNFHTLNKTIQLFKDKIY